jgi:hypothetical protein
MIKKAKVGEKIYFTTYSKENFNIKTEPIKFGIIESITKGRYKIKLHNSFECTIKPPKNIFRKKELALKAIRKDSYRKYMLEEIIKDHGGIINALDEQIDTLEETVESVKIQMKHHEKELEKLEETYDKYY